MNELRSRLSDLPEPDGSDFWSERRRDLRRAVSLEGNDSFLNWASIRATMFVGTGAPWTQAELDYLKAQPDWQDFWYPALEDSPVGGPELIGGERYSGNTIQQAFHLCLWQNTTGIKISELPSICEVGGGYGAMRYLVDRLGFRGDYLLYDSPEYLELQRYYLSRNDLPATFASVATLPKSMPLWSALLIGVCSLSEMDYDERSIALWALPASHYLIVYQDLFEGYQNDQWFRPRFPKATYLPAPELPTHTYLIQ